MEAPTSTDLPLFGTMAPDVFAINKYSGNNVYTDKQSSREEREKI